MKVANSEKQDITIPLSYLREVFHVFGNLEAQKSNQYLLAFGWHLTFFLLTPHTLLVKHFAFSDFFALLCQISELNVNILILTMQYNPNYQ